jgi:hypothetical protein
MQAAAEYPWVYVRISPARDGVAAIERIERLTPYLGQVIFEDAIAWGEATVQLQPLDGDSPQLLPMMEGLQRRVRMLPGRKIHVAIEARGL